MNSDLSNIGERLEWMRIARVNSDYRTGKTVTKQDAESIFFDAEETKATIDRIGVANLVSTFKAELERPY